MKATHLLGSLGCLALVACASSPKREPIKPYLSVAGHEAVAENLELVARGHQGRFNPYARANAGMCPQHPASDQDICWTAFVNPTERHVKRAEEQRRLAAEHRAAAQTLRDAESFSCAGIPPVDRDESLFDHHEDILRVEPLHGGVSRYINEPWTEGVVVTFRNVLGMSTPWLQHVVDCQVARNTALGNRVPERPQDLLVPKGIKASVGAVPDGFAVTVRAGGKEIADELLRRADALNMAVQIERARPPEPTEGAPNPIDPSPTDPLPGVDIPPT